MRDRMRFLGAIGLALVLFPVALATHEVMHLVIYSALGVPSELLVTHWKLGSLGVPIFGLHAAPVGIAQAPFHILVANNGLGPSIAALLLFTLWLSIGPPAKLARAALLANVFALAYFAAVELTYPLLERFANVDADVLLLPELNYGVTLLIIVLVCAASTGRRRPRTRSTVRRRTRPAQPAEQLPAS
jgi:hypothetical protein